MASGTDRSDLELRDYVAVFLRRRWLIVGVTAAFVLAALVSTALQTPIYRATAEVLLRPGTAEQLLASEQVVQNPQAASARTQTEIRVMESRSVRDAVTDELGFEPSVSIQARDDTEVVTISAESPDPEQAAEVAGTYAATYVQLQRDRIINELLAAIDEVQAQINRLDDQQDELDEPSDAIEASRENYVEQLDQLQLSSELATGGAQIVSEASVPGSPVKPTPVRNVLLALVLGLVVSIIAAFVRDHLDDSLRTKEDLEQASGGANLLGMVPSVPNWKDHEATTLVSISSPQSAPAEAYRTLRTSLQFIGLERSMQITQVTSPGPSDGKTTTLSNLAVSLAHAGQRVLAVDCDLRRPRLHEFFGMSNAIGFTSLLLGTTPTSAAIKEVPHQSYLFVLPSGPPPPNPAEILASGRAKSMLRSLASDYDVVLMDCPPIVPVTDGLVLAQISDAIIVVASAGKTRKRDAARAFELLDQIDAPVIGTVLNNVKQGGTYDLKYGGYVYSAGPPNGNGWRSSRILGRGLHRNQGTRRAGSRSSQSHSTVG